MIFGVVQRVSKYNAFEIKTQSKTCEIVLEFYGVDKPEFGDEILIHENLLNPDWCFFTQPYAFETFANMTIDEVQMANNPEFIVFRSVKLKKSFVLRRIYG